MFLSSVFLLRVFPNNSVFFWRVTVYNFSHYATFFNFILFCNFVVLYWISLIFLKIFVHNVVLFKVFLIRLFLRDFYHQYTVFYWTYFYLKVCIVQAEYFLHKWFFFYRISTSNLYFVHSHCFLHMNESFSHCNENRISH